MALALGLIIVSLAGQCYAGSSAALQVGFYKGKCGIFDVEGIVAGLVKAKFFKDPTIAPALIRMQFHDCFVSGCDASLLLNGGSSERFASPNLSVRGYEFIDEVKDAVESFCPGLVSCADIIAIATRDVISLSGGGRYRVETGRRDGFESLAENVDLPGPQIPVSESIAAFARKGLNVTDMVYLLGGHTVGVAHCFFFQDRLYNFQNTGRPDPTMDRELVRSLRSRCPQKSTGYNIVSLDQNFLSSFIVDNSFYQQILRKRGVLQIDQRLALDPRTRDIVTTIASGRASDFGSKFGEAMIKMGAIQVLTGTEGEIRKSCSVIN
ncbi:peroxidase 60 [Juglans microcarpa x Juglans regia]|uniref:peroxidase 60 n=1 Tax=Juglans microcarpa x Juglans regia TaxID=2249226 RepID=UPI001B7E1692|nr:peroxidase 60 [Juglans microcarpa x Juglans regia]